MSEQEVGAWAEKQGGFEGHRFFKTSGSSGEEKWIALSEEALAWSARAVMEALGICESDVLGLAIPRIHVGGYGLALRAELAGARLVEMEGKWDARRFADWCEAEGVTVSSLVPTQVHDLVAGGIEASQSLRVIVVGGGALDEDLCEEARALGWPVVPSYGMTETGSQVATGDGLPLLPGWEARVEEGRLALKGGGLLTAVIRRKDRGFEWEDPKVDGWYLTSDRVEMTAKGLRVLGRADRVVKVLGELVDLDDLEKFWKEALGEEVAIITKSDARRGVTLLLFFEGEGGRVEELNARLPGPERVGEWKGVARLPRSPLGKINRSSLGEF